MQRPAGVRRPDQAFGGGSVAQSADIGGNGGRRGGRQGEQAVRLGLDPRDHLAGVERLAAQGQDEEGGPPPPPILGEPE